MLRIGLFFIGYTNQVECCISKSPIIGEKINYLQERRLQLLAKIQITPKERRVTFKRPPRLLL